MNDNALLIRQLGPDDRDDYFQLRLRGLRAHPDSFGQSYEEALAKGASQHDAILEGSRAAEGDFLLGAYASAGTPLIGVVGLLRIPNDKQRHKAAMVGMYVAPEPRAAASGERCSMNYWRGLRVWTVYGKSSCWSAAATKPPENFMSRSVFANMAAKSAR